MYRRNYRRKAHARTNLLGVATGHIARFEEEMKLPVRVITSYGDDAAAFKQSQTCQVVLLAVALPVINLLPAYFKPTLLFLQVLYLYLDRYSGKGR